MPIRHALLLTTLVFAIWTANATARAIGDEALPSNYVPSGETLFALDGAAGAAARLVMARKAIEGLIF